jgi:uncharacterized caspase-like protein
VVGLLTLVLCAAEQPAMSQTERKVALVIGNTAYRGLAPLRNAANDAADLAATLRGLDFEVVSGINLDLAGFERTAAKFREVVLNADVVFFYFSGHGLQHQGVNYLAPIDASVEREADIDARFVRVQSMISDLHRARVGGVKIFVLDACRDNQVLENLRRTSAVAQRDAQGTRSVGRGFAPVGLAPERVEGMLIAFATQANDVALDGVDAQGRNSPFADALIREIVRPGQEVRQTFQRVRSSVYEQSGRTQLPELSDSLLGEFYFAALDRSVRNDPGVKPLEALTPRKGPGRFLSLAISPDGRHVLTGGEDGDRGSGVLYDGYYSVRYWDLETGRLVRSFGEGQVKLEGVALSANGATAYINTDQGSLQSFDVQSGQPLKAISVDPGRFILSPDGRFVVTASYQSKTIKVWDVGSGRQTRRLGPVGEHPIPLAISGDGRRLLVGDGFRSSATLWDLTNGEMTGKLDVRVNNIGTGAFSPNGRVLATGPGVIHLWDASTGKPLGALPSEEARSVTFSNDGMHIVAAGFSSISTWDVASRTLVREVATGDSVEKIAFSSNGRLIISAGSKLALRHVLTGQEIAAIRQFPRGEWLSLATGFGYVGSSGHEHYFFLKSGEEVSPIDDAFRNRWKRNNLRAILAPLLTGVAAGR